MTLSTRYWQPPRLRRRGQRWIMLKRIGLASLLLGGSSLTARHTRADDILWTLGADGYWDVAANWSNNQIPTSNDDAMNMTGFLISLANTGFANSFTTNSNFNLTGTLNLTSKLTQSGSGVFTTNGGALIFTGSSSQIVSGNIVNNGGYVGGLEGTTLTLDSNTLVHGGNNGFVGAYDINANGGGLVNKGTISADVNGETLLVQPGQNPSTGVFSALTNTGTLQALNGGILQINVYGNFDNVIGGKITADGSGSLTLLYGNGTLSNGATFTASNGGQVSLGGDYDNQNHSITIADGSLSFNFGALRNSTVNVTGNGTGLDFLNGNGTLDNVTVNGAINAGGSTVFVYNNLTATKGLSISSGLVQFQTDSTLKSGNVALDGGFVGGLEGTTLTLGSNTLVHGGNNGYVGAYDVNADGGNLINNGTISADVNGQNLFVQPGQNPTTNVFGALTNTGTLQATGGGTLYVNNYGGSGTSTGTIKADANSTVSLNNVTQTAGQTIANGTIVTNNSFTLKGGSFIGDGAVSGTLANTGATVSPGTLTTAGHLTVNGDYSQDASSQLLIKLGGTIQGTNFDLLSVANTATLHGALDVQLINNFVPTAGETFDFLTYQSRIGDFDSLVSLNGGYTYSVTYNDASGIGTIHVNPLAVPEAGTVVSLSILLLGTGCVLRRQRR